MSNIRSKSRNAYPGDLVRVMTARAWDESGNEYPAGTEFMPFSYGHNGVAGRDEQKVWITGREIVFVAAT